MLKLEAVFLYYILYRKPLKILSLTHTKTLCQINKRKVAKYSPTIIFKTVSDNKVQIER